MAVGFAIAALLFCSVPTRAQAWPTSMTARRWVAPRGFIRQALCIHRFESAGPIGWHRAWVTWDGRLSVYAGGLQFERSTWDRAGGRGEPWAWSPREQVYRAFVIWRKDGRSWSEWGTRAKCGLR